MANARPQRLFHVKITYVCWHGGKKSVHVPRMPKSGGYLSEKCSPSEDDEDGSAIARQRFSIRLCDATCHFLPNLRTVKTISAPYHVSLNFVYQ